jgi:thiopeptide-type bacteriocin biosynthesis protein
VNWHSLHIHYYTSPDLLLVESIAPVVASCRSTHLSQWFFLRYWKGGPHVRLRLLLDEATEGATLRAVRSEIGEYLVQHPSTGPLPEVIKDSLRMLARFEADDEQSQEIVPDNTVRFHPYEPEYNRYGGKLGVALAESLFEASSDIVLEVLKIISETPTRRLGISFAMMLAGLRGAGLTETSMADFLVGYYRFWARYLPDNIAASWAAGLEEKQRSLLPHATAVLSDSSPPGSRVGQALARWKSAVSTVVTRLDTRAGDILPNVIMPIQDAPMEYRRDFLLLNYLHTHNNRLGVTPGHEAYLAYLAHQVVCRLAGFRSKLETRPDSNPSEQVIN